MEVKWIMIGAACMLAAISLPAVVAEYSKGNARTACYQAEAEAIKQHVEFKENCSK